MSLCVLMCVPVCAYACVCVCLCACLCVYYMRCTTTEISQQQLLHFLYLLPPLFPRLLAPQLFPITCLQASGRPQTRLEEDPANRRHTGKTTTSSPYSSPHRITPPTLETPAPTRPHLPRTRPLLEGRVCMRKRCRGRRSWCRGMLLGIRCDFVFCVLHIWAIVEED